MSDAFLEYVALLDDVGQIPLAARESPTLSIEQRAETMEWMVRFVRDRVLPQSDREEAGLEALFYGGVAPVAGDRGAAVMPRRDHETILAPVDELARADPRDQARVQELLYRLHAAISGHFGEAQLMVASAAAEEAPLMQRRSVATSAPSATDTSEPDHPVPSCWFG
jgi:hypothetical protein